MMMMNLKNNNIITILNKNKNKIIGKVLVEARFGWDDDKNS